MMISTNQNPDDAALRAAQEWLNNRIRPGNWIDIDPAEEIHSGIVGWMRTIVHMHQVRFSPEVRRRRDIDALPEDFFLWAAQHIQTHEGELIVRLNDEVRGIPYVRTGRPVEKEEPILLADLEGLEYFDLVDEELDAGHFTIFWTGTKWVGSFDFRAGRAKCLSLLDKALKFTMAAKLSSDNGLAEPAIDALHTACELVAKSRLILDHQPAHKWKSHAKVSAEINRLGQRGNIDPSFLTLFNNLSDIRGHAKYATGYDAKPPSIDDVELVDIMAAELRASIAPQKPDGVT